MYVFAFSEVCQKKHVFRMWFLGAAKKVCDPVCGLSGGPGRVGPGRARVGPDRAWQVGLGPALFDTLDLLVRLESVESWNFTTN